MGRGLNTHLYGKLYLYVCKAIINPHTSSEMWVRIFTAKRAHLRTTLNQGAYLVAGLPCHASSPRHLSQINVTFFLKC